MRSNFSFAILIFLASRSFAQSGEIFIEHSRHTTPPAKDDYELRRFWKSKNGAIRIERYTGISEKPDTTLLTIDSYSYRIDGHGVTKELVNGAGPRPTLLEDKSGKYSGLDFGKEIEFFKGHNAAHGLTTIDGKSVEQYVIKAGQFELRLMVDPKTLKPQEFGVTFGKTIRTLRYLKYDINAKVDPAKFRPPEMKPFVFVIEKPLPPIVTPQQIAVSAGPKLESRAPKMEVPSAQETTETYSTPWNIKKARNAVSKMKAGDRLEYMDPDGAISYTWVATDEALSAIKATASNNYQFAYGIMRPLAEHGDASAQYYMWEISRYGHLGNKDNIHKWLLNSHKQGFVFSTHALGNDFLVGDGVKADREEAIKLYHEALRHGFLEAELTLGEAYLKGPKPDEKEGLAWLHRAVDHGVESASTVLELNERMIARENKFNRENAEAINKIEAAASKGDPYATYLLGAVYEGGKDRPADLAKSAHLYQKAADQGQVEAMVALAFLFLDGRGVDRDATRSLAYLKSAANSGSVPAAGVLTSLYHTGYAGIAKDESVSRAYFNAMTGKGSVDAIYGTGIYLLQRKTSPDKDTGNKLIEFAASRRQPDAEYYLGNKLLEDSTGDKKANNQKAFEWLLAAAEQGHAPSQVLVAGLYEGRNGFPRDMIKANHWYEVAFAQGDPTAASWLRSKRQSSAFYARQIKQYFDKAFEGNNNIRGLILSLCTREFDVPLLNKSEDETRASLQSAAERFYSPGRKAVEKNPQLVECLRRAEAADSKVKQ